MTYRLVAAAVVLVLGACEEQPSVLDDVSYSGLSEHARKEVEAWHTLDQRAAPLGARLDLLREALDYRQKAPAELQRRADKLIAWMDAGGTIPPPPTSTDDLFRDNFYTTPTVTLIGARPTDDRLFEAALYLAARLRQDGLGMVDGALGLILMKKLMALRPIAPAFAAKYAPTDAEVFRSVASEAVFSRRASWEAGARYPEQLEDPVNEEFLVFSLRLADAPTERIAFLAFLNQLIVERPGGYATMFAMQARRQFDAVDAYQRWLANGQTL